MRAESKSEAKIHLSEVEALHSSLAQRRADGCSTNQLYEKWMHGLTIEESQHRLRTSYHAVAKSTNALTVKW